MKEKQQTIMLVDDERTSLSRMKQALAPAGYRLVFALNGTDALKRALSNPPDLFLLDISMPDINGYELCRQFKAIPELCDIPVIFVSALTEVIDKVEAFNCGGVDYVTKPFQFAEVQSRLEAHLKLRRYQQQLQVKNKELERALSELKTTQSQLIQSAKMASLGVLTAGIAHEINNPVNFISSGIKGLRSAFDDLLVILAACDDITGNNVQAKAAEIAALKTQFDYEQLLAGVRQITANIENGVERTVEIIKGLHAFARLDDDVLVSMDIHECIDATLVILKSRYKGRIRIHKEYGILPRLEGVPAKLSQAFMNILGNAIDAIEEEDNASKENEIAIKTYRECRHGQPYVFIEIRDSGPGIRDEFREKLFDPFFTTKEIGHGIGLGLSITQGIIQSHQGKLEFETELGVGSLFRILLPESG